MFCKFCNQQQYQESCECGSPICEGTTGTCCSCSPQNKLHIYGQDWNHYPAFLVGTRVSLRKLIETIEKALDEGCAKATPACEDGEGFDVVVVNTENKTEWEKLILPYTEAESMGYRGPKNAIGPYNLQGVREILKKT